MTTKNSTELPMPIHPQTKIGHIHLTVADLERSLAFYRDLLGFEVTMRYGDSAVFLSAGGYHHHLGTNLWAGSSARSPEDDQAQLLEWTLELPDVESVRRAAESLASAESPVEIVPEGTTARTRDPWGTPLAIVARKEQGS